MKANNTANIPTAEFTNNIDVGSLKITKTWQGVPDGTDVSGLAIEITNPDGSKTNITYADFDTNGEYVIEDVPVGSEYSVKETNAGTLIADYTLVATSKTEGTGTVAKDTVVTISLLNKYDQDLGSLKIKKNVTVNGAATTKTLADGTYHFTITGPDNYSATKTIEIKNGVSNEVQVDDLVPGTYTVAEDTSKNPDGVSLTGKNNIQVEVKGNNNTTNVPTAEFTNDYTPSPCEGEIQVRKVLKGRAWTSSDSFTFTLKALDGAPMPSQTRITITRSDADQTKSFGTIVFTEPGTYVYSVSEVRGGDAYIKYDTKEHKITIEVVDDTHGNLVAKEGTQLIQIVTIKNTYSETPPTGDSRHLFLYASLMITSMMGLCMLYLPYRRKKRKE